MFLKSLAFFPLTGVDVVSWLVLFGFVFDRFQVVFVFIVSDDAGQCS